MAQFGTRFRRNSLAILNMDDMMVRQQDASMRRSRYPVGPAARNGDKAFTVVQS